ncbi:hypothetical protein BSLG_007646 [Batrachochytrium salamandrivorans]|nr:hypothetical protein BSLG_007646 [Batrachochytrium salamandrivorans]
MSLPASLHISNKAYSKILLHSAKYSMDPVYGVLLGTRDKEGSSATAVVVTDAVPMFHSHWIMSPPLQFGMEQIEIYAKQTGLSIVGSYYGNELNSESAVLPSVDGAASQIDTHLDGGSLDVSRIKKQTFSLVPLARQAGAWKQLKGTPVTNNEDCHSNAMGLVKSNLYEKLYDLENHLEDISLDWLSNNALSI